MTCLQTIADFKVPLLRSESEYLARGPSFILHYHPALGPLYSIIAQKIHTGELKEGAELKLEIAELMIRNLKLQGSLIIKARHLLGHLEDDILTYSEKTGKCILENVEIFNDGVDYDATKDCLERRDCKAKKRHHSHRRRRRILR